MSASLTTTTVIHSHSAWWRSRALWVPLVVVMANFGFLIAWPGVTGYLFRTFPAVWSWKAAWHEGFQGWTLAYVPLLGIWLCFSIDGAVVRFPCAAAAIAVSTLLLLFQWSGYWSFDFFRTYYLPMWPRLMLAAIQFVALVHLVFYPLRQFAGWRLDFSPAPKQLPSCRRRFQFTLRDVAHLSVVTAIALAAIRASTHALASSGKNDLFLMPTILRVISFGQILIPALACAWLVLGRKRQWIGALVLALALACPAVISYTGWHVALSLGIRELWDAHWQNVGAAVCVGFNLLTLRLCGLRSVIIAR